MSIIKRDFSDTFPEYFRDVWCGDVLAFLEWYRHISGYSMREFIVFRREMREMFG